MATRPTPDDKLLEAIENPGTAKGKKLSSARKKGNPPGFLPGSFISRKTLLNFFRLKVINRIFVMACVGATVFLAFDFTQKSTEFEKRFMRIETETIKAKKGKGNLPEFKVDSQESLILAEERNIFSLVPPEEEVVADTPPPVDLSLGLEQLKLVGILWSSTDPQVMIEDLQGGRTFLLRKGDTINEYQIRGIHKDHAILGIEKQEWEIR